MLCCAFLAGLLASRLARWGGTSASHFPCAGLLLESGRSGLTHRVSCRTVLVVAPKTLLAHWEHELGTCGLHSYVQSFIGTPQTRWAADGSRAGHGQLLTCGIAGPAPYRPHCQLQQARVSCRSAALRVVARRPGILLVTYGTVLHNAAELARLGDGGADGGRRLSWDWVILDEAGSHACPQPGSPGMHALWWASKHSLVHADPAAPLKQATSSAGLALPCSLLHAHMLGQVGMIAPAGCAQGHIIKNPKTQLNQALHSLPACHRLVISGTPIQNNLGELHALMTFACPVRPCLWLLLLPLLVCWSVTKCLTGQSPWAVRSYVSLCGLCWQGLTGECMLRGCWGTPNTSRQPLRGPSRLGQTGTPARPPSRGAQQAAGTCAP